MHLHNTAASNSPTLLPIEIQSARPQHKDYPVVSSHTYFKAAPNSSTPKSLFRPTNRKKKNPTHNQPWRTSAARSSTCKPAPSTKNPPKASLSLSAQSRLWLSKTPKGKNPLTQPHQLRPPQMFRHEPHHQSQRPRLRATLHRQGRRERPVHRREHHVRHVRVRKGDGGGGRLVQPAGAAGRVSQGCVEWESLGEWCGCGGDV